jgi:hypothetical protein
MTSTEVKKIKRLIIQLDDTQRREIKTFLEDYERDTLEKRRSINEEFNKSLGPISSISCPYCGK